MTGTEIDDEIIARELKRDRKRKNREEKFKMLKRSLVTFVVLKVKREIN
jgi:hypothetical protein